MSENLCCLSRIGFESIGILQLLMMEVVRSSSAWLSKMRIRHVRPVAMLSNRGVGFSVSTSLASFM
jgi:hypothetical protein